MAKELPYFKFEPNQWDNGNIQICSREDKGLFIDLCSSYWSRLGELPYALALQKHCNGSKDALQRLVDAEIITVSEGHIIIEFLDEQLNEFQVTSEKRRKAANKRWKDASALQMDSKSNAIREDKKRKEEKKEDENVAVPASHTFEEREKDFMQLLSPHLPEYGKEMLRAFFDYWTERNPNGKKMRFEMQKVFDINKRLATWKRNDKKISNGTTKREQNINDLRVDFAERASQPD